jgi:hypothetical protein
MAHARYVDLYCGVWGYCGWGGVDSSHRLIETYDGDADGFGVRTHYWLKNGASGSVRDPDGYGGVVGARSVGTSRNPVVSFQVCAGPDGRDTYCTRRYYA